MLYLVTRGSYIFIIAQNHRSKVYQRYSKPQGIYLGEYMTLCYYIYYILYRLLFARKWYKQFNQVLLPIERYMTPPY